MRRHNESGLGSSSTLQCTSGDGQHAPPACGSSSAASSGSGALSRVPGVSEASDMPRSSSAAAWGRKRPAAGSPPLRSRSASSHMDADSCWLAERAGAAPTAAAAAASRARAAADDWGAASRCSAGCAGAAAATPSARPRWTTRVASWVPRAGTVVCAAARAAPAAGAAAGCAAWLCPVGPAAAVLAGRARRVRFSRSQVALRLATQDLPRSLMRIGQEPCVSAHAKLCTLHAAERSVQSE